jgi:hypothetical protein
MTTATIEHTYARQDTPMVNAEHFVIKGRTIYHCITEDCDGRHHVWCSCAR